jgi:hypothetical protein
MNKVLKKFQIFINDLYNNVPEKEVDMTSKHLEEGKLVKGFIIDFKLKLYYKKVIS